MDNALVCGRTAGQRWQNRTADGSLSLGATRVKKKKSDAPRSGVDERRREGERAHEYEDLLQGNIVEIQG